MSITFLRPWEDLVDLAFVVPVLTYEHRSDGMTDVKRLRDALGTAEGDNGYCAWPPYTDTWYGSMVMVRLCYEQELPSQDTNGR